MKAAAGGEALIAPAITARLLSTFATQHDRTAVEPLDALSPREEEVLDLVARGRTNTEIGEELFLSVSTVKAHITALMAKLAARNRVEIAIWAYESGRMDGKDLA